MKESSSKINFMVKVDMNGMMEDPMMEIGLKGEWKAMEYLHGKVFI